ncbi:MAG: DEAD/DEAH box helicase [Deltaproteobacteria bacterium]|nr:DEAD/DEAH box helicase [Deltaproteobacteria bacterium]
MRFDRGTIVLDGLPRSEPAIPDAIWDERSGLWRAPAFRHDRLVATLRERGHTLDSALESNLRMETGPWQRPELRPYQEEAIQSWNAFGRKGVVVLPTGAGKTRVAIAAAASVRASCLVLCPTRALMAQWQRELGRWYGGPIGMIGDGENDLQKVTIITFESAWRHLDRVGDRFELVVVDEAHHFQGGSRSEALEMLPASMRLGLSATPPDPGTPGAERLADLLGPTVCELGVCDLVGTYLADYDRVYLGVKLTDEEREEYETEYANFSVMRRAWLRANPDADWATFMRAMARIPDGRKAIDGYQRAVKIASLPQAKRALTTRLLSRHADTKTLVFTALADHAYDISLDNLIPVITAEIGRAERAEILSKFGQGKVRAVVSARVLNEGIDVPDASVAIVVAGALGKREYIQRIGRVLRPRPGKRAIIYELATTGTLDDERARARRRRFAA